MDGRRLDEAERVRGSIAREYGTREGRHTVDARLDDTGRIEAISALLTEAEAAHGVYEATVLGGVYDQEWPNWYATYAVEHGIGELLGGPITAERLGTLLAGSFEAFKAADPTPTAPWATWTAGRIAAEGITPRAPVAPQPGS